MNETDKNSTRQARYIAFQVRLPLLLALLAFNLAGFALCFWVGVLVGEGDDKLNRLLPPPVALLDTPLPAVEEREPIPPEELIFQERLRQNANLETLEDRQPSLANFAAQEHAPPPARLERPRDSAPLFQYQFQVASYSKKQQAEDMAAMLARNYESSVETVSIQNVPRFRVLISFQGQEEHLPDLRQALKRDFNLDGILQRSQKQLTR
ncbi:MAG: SPOR domain-containing protein [Desulfovibrionaceae bacterium]|nr:SPOR domain-containing protein [Desulfovibrionaceae bacterium]